MVGAHEADLRVQGTYGVNYKHYWVDEAAGKVFCLVDAPDKESAARVHREAHGLEAVRSIRRILEIATIDTLGLENSIVRSRTLISAALAAAKLLETGDLEDRIAGLEAAIGGVRVARPDDLFPDALR